MRPAEDKVVICEDSHRSGDTRCVACIAFCQSLHTIREAGTADRSQVENRLPSDLVVELANGVAPMQFISFLISVAFPTSFCIPLARIIVGLAFSREGLGRDGVLLWRVTGNLQCTSVSRRRLIIQKAVSSFFVFPSGTDTHN